MSIPALSPVRVQSGATEAEPGQTLFTANVQPGVQSSYFTDVDVLTAETGSQLLYRGDEGNFGDEGWEGRMLPGGGAKAGDAGCSPRLSPGKSHGSGLLCCTGFMHCPLLGNDKNCSTCLVQQCKHKKTCAHGVPGCCLNPGLTPESGGGCGFTEPGSCVFCFGEVLVESGK